ncbi:MAG: PaaI family thioesterase [Acidobacteria bacterium]|nr:PaaI family thioesterase [Acidobacteriota bacterium]TDI52783.1 MAG: PaaI family thioesterase [Acidobacteriota bacterium]
MKNPFEERPTYVGLSGIELTEASSEFAAGRIEITENHHQPYGMVHGGVYCTLAETLASTGAAIWAVEQGFAGAVGVANKTDFLRATTGGVLIGEATPIHRGRTQQLWQVNITREEDGKLVAQSQVRLHNVNNTEF